jgi:hypothetical protein
MLVINNLKWVYNGVIIVCPFFMKLKELKFSYSELFDCEFDLIPIELLPTAFNYNLTDIKGEEWTDIPGYENLYRASIFGRIKALKKRHIFGHYLPEKILKQQFRFDYFYADLHKEGCGELHRSVHNIIATTFCVKDEGDTCINHLNGDKLNNNVSNLEWCTQSENHLHALALGLRRNFGERCHLSKLTEVQVKEIFISTERNKDLSNRYNVHRDTITLIRSGKIWNRITDLLVIN